MKINFLTTTNVCNGYGMTREYFKKYLPRFDIDLVESGSDVDLILHIPPAIKFSKSPVKVLYTMIEGDTLPESWKQYLKLADLILVPSKFVYDTFAKSGFYARIFPLGYDGELFKPAPVEHKTFTFLHYEAFQDRKGWDELLNAWLISGLAEEETECQLVLKTVKPFSEIVEKTKDMFIPSNVKIVCGELPHRCIYEMLREADCFVFPSRGEGFSLPPIEAMACGVPAIISKAHSHLDYYDEKYMYGVTCDTQIPATYQSWENQGHFVRCDYRELADTLRYVFDHKDEAKAKGISSVDYVSRYDYMKIGKQLADFLRAL